MSSQFPSSPAESFDPQDSWKLSRNINRRSSIDRILEIRGLASRCSYPTYGPHEFSCDGPRLSIPGRVRSQILLRGLVFNLMLLKTHSACFKLGNLSSHANSIWQNYSAIQTIWSHISLLFTPVQRIDARGTESVSADRRKLLRAGYKNPWQKAYLLG